MGYPVEVPPLTVCILSPFSSLFIWISYGESYWSFLRVPCAGETSFCTPVLTHLWLQTGSRDIFSWKWWEDQKAVSASHDWLSSKSDYSDDFFLCKNVGIFHPSGYFRLAPRFGKLPYICFYEAINRSAFGLIYSFLKQTSSKFCTVPLEKSEAVIKGQELLVTWGTRNCRCNSATVFLWACITLALNFD